jgi:hypothetical protein
MFLPPSSNQSSTFPTHALLGPSQIDLKLPTFCHLSLTAAVIMSEALTADPIEEQDVEQ